MKRYFRAVILISLLLLPFLFKSPTVSLFYLVIFSSGLVFSSVAVSLNLTKTGKSLGFLVLLVYAVYLVYMAFIRYCNFSSELIDLSYYHSVVRQYSQFLFPRIWDIPSRYVWGDHFEPILFIFVPLYFLVKNPSLLFFLQSVLVVSGIIPLYLIVLNNFKNKFLAISFAFSYLLFGGLQMGYAYGFHPIVLLPPFLFWAYYFLEKGKINLYFIFVFLSLAVKEEVSFIMIFFGLFILLVKRQIKIAILTILAGLLWYILCFHFIFPRFNGGGFGHWGQYGEMGTNGVLTMFKYFLTKPLSFLNILTTPYDKIETFFHIFGSFSFLPLFYPPTLLLIIPSLLEKLLSSNIAQFNGFHYSAAITAAVVIANIESLKFILRRFKKNRILGKSGFWAWQILYVSFFANIFFGYPPLALPFIRKDISIPSDHLEKIYKVIDLLPQKASISAQYQIAAHIDRPYGKILPAPRQNENSDLVVLDTKLPLVLSTSDQYLEYVSDLEKKGYKIISAEDGIYIFKKR